MQHQIVRDHVGWAEVGREWGLLIVLGCPLIGLGVQALLSEGPP